MKPRNQKRFAFGGFQFQDFRLPPVKPLDVHLILDTVYVLF